MTAGNKPNLWEAVPFFIVSNMENSLQFYCDGLGFSIVLDWTPRGPIEWCRIERDGVALMLQQPRKEGAPTPKGFAISICFTCEDALALYHEFTGKGLTVSEPFVGNNMWDICLKDPDGFVLHFESSTDVPEETTYTEWLATGKK